MKKYFLSAMTKYKSQLNQLFFLISTISIISILFSCEKEPDKFGLEILPTDENFNIKVDTTFNILATTVKFDSIITYLPQDSSFNVYNSVIVGNYTDNIVGSSQSSLLMNFYPDTLTSVFKNLTQVDSLVFYIKLSSIYGDTLSDLQFDIWELQKSLSYKSKYSSNISESEYKNINSLVQSKVLKYNDSIKIRIDNDVFINKLVNITPADSFSIANIIKFQEYFKGLYLEVKSPSDPKVFVTINPWKSSGKFYTRLRMYYRSNDNKDTLSLSYNIYTPVSKFIHDYTGTAIETALQDNELNQKVTYVEGIGGLGTRIRIPELSKWADKAPVSINKAELIIPIESIDGIPSGLYPRKLCIKTYQNDSSKYIEYGFGQTFLGGGYDSIKGGYVFNLTKHVQKIANSKLRGPVVENTDFIIMVDGYKRELPFSFKKTALNFSTGKRANLNITYSKQ